MKLPPLLNHVQRDRMISRIHRVRIRRLLLGSILIGLGTLIPPFHGHEVLHAFATDAAKGLGYIPILKLFEDIMS
jgi:hypothetical protein